MAREQRKLVEKLESFTNILADIVDIMKDDIKNRGEMSADKLASGISDNIVQIAEDIKAIKTDISSIKSDTSAIRKVVENLKTQKEKGLVGEVGDKKSQGAIMDGVKMIILIASGVLAIGLAFKLVGKIDFASVIALSLSMIAIAKAVEIISKIENLNLKTVLLASATMVIMAGAIAASAWLLKFVQPMGFMQLLTIGLLAITLAGVLYFTIEAIGKTTIKPSAIATIALLPIILPLISLGILLSSDILANVKPIPFMALVGVVMLAVAVGAMLFAIKPILSMKIDSNDIAKILLLPVIIPIISLSMVLASVIFQMYQPVEGSKLINLLFFGISAGVAILMFSLSMKLLGKMNIKDILMGSVAIIAVSLAMVAVSWILQLGNFDKYPSLGWALGVGMSLVLFTLAIIPLGIIAATGVGALVILAGIGMLAGIALSMVAVSKLLQGGKWDTGYPSPSWALGVGTAIYMFASAFAVVGAMNAISKLFGGPSLTEFIPEIVGAIVAANKAFSEAGAQNWSGYPSISWVNGVGGAIGAFANFLASLKKGNARQARLAMEAIVDGIIDANLKFSQVKSWTGYPSPEWVNGITSAINAFSNVQTTMDNIKSLENIEVDKITKNINKLARSFNNLSFALNSFGSSASRSIGLLSQSAMSLAVLGALDVDRITQTLDMLEQKSGTLKKVSSETSSIVGFLDRVLSKAENKLGGVSASETKVESKKGETKESEMSQLIKHVSNIDNNLSELLKLKKSKPESEEKVPVGENVQSNGFFK